MKNNLLPAAWLILLMVGVPFFSESVYTPSLPDIAMSLAVSDSWVEYTLTIYLFGIAVGTLFWGKISDKFGRKPCVIAGFLIFLLGCWGCYLSDSITQLLGSRFIQAFGGSVGSVLSQAIVRDAFQGPALGKMYATIGASLAFFPAIGPVVGGEIDQHFGWATIFLFLMGCAILVTGLVIWLLPETHPVSSREKVKMKTTLLSMSRDRHVIGSMLLVGLTNGLNFSYYAEGPFFMIELLKLSPSVYGATFWGIAFANFSGGYLAHKFSDHFSAAKILNIGITTVVFGTVVFAGLVFATTVPHILIVG
jgi:DHA1 family bicyclomycin/chloramphenicol resistance-like MFS transporter